MLSGMLFLLAVFLGAGFAESDSDGDIFGNQKLCVKNAISSSAANAYEACSITTGMDVLGNRVSTVENDLSNVKNDITNVDGSVTALAARVTQLEGREEAAPLTPALVALVRLADQHAPGGGDGGHATSPFLFETRAPGSAFAELSAAAAASFGGGGVSVARFSAEPAGPLQVAVKIVSDQTLSAAFTAANTYGFLLTLTCTFVTEAPTPAPVDPTPAPVDPTPPPVDPLDVLTVYAGWTFYKVPVSGAMTSANVHAACEARGLVTPCFHAMPGHSYNGGEAECTEVLPPTDASCNSSSTVGRLSCSLCGTTSASSCDAQRGTYYYLVNWSSYPGAACGVEHTYCVDGRNYSDKVAVCAEPEDSG